MNFFEFIQQDKMANGRNTKGKMLSFLFRLANYASVNHASHWIIIPYLIFYKVFVEYLMGIEIPYNLKIGKGLCIYHGQALVIHKNVIIGSHCTIRQSTTIGNNGKTSDCPVIGNNVNIGANVCIIGAITIGDNVVIGAGCVVVKSVPPNSVVVGNPAHIINQMSSSVNISDSFSLGI